MPDTPGFITSVSSLRPSETPYPRTPWNMATALRMPGRTFVRLALSAVLLLTVACGGSESADQPASDRASADDPAGLTPEQLEHGVGPITSVELGAIDPDLAETGEGIFTIKCSACHKMDERYVGPALRDVTERRSPAFIMNMILNPEGMLAQHPEVRALLAQYAVPMANQNLTEADARAVLEYLREEAQEGPES